MRCFSCKKKFDYEKYYGICPKCGGYNKPETPAEQHQAYHDTYDGGYSHSEGHYNTYTEFKKETGQKSSVFVKELEKATRPKTKGTGLLAASVIFMVICLLIAMILAVNAATVIPEPVLSEEQAAEWEILSYEIGQEFELQEMTLKVTEYRTIADWTTLEGLEKGKKLVAIRVEGSSDGEYEDYNRLAAPYLVADSSYYRPLSSYDFEPYARMYDVMPLLDETALQWETSCDGWYVFLIDEDITLAQLCFEDCVWEDWEKVDITKLHTIFLALEENMEGGAADEV